MGSGGASGRGRGQRARFIPGRGSQSPLRVCTKVGPCRWPLWPVKMASENCRQIASCLQIEAEKAWRRSEPERALVTADLRKVKGNFSLRRSRVHGPRSVRSEFLCRSFVKPRRGRSVRDPHTDPRHLSLFDAVGQYLITPTAALYFSQIIPCSYHAGD